MGTRLYVGNLPYTTDEDSLRVFFGDGQEGRQVTQVKIITDRETGRPRGFAFVELADANHARVAIEALNGHDLGGRTIVVSEAREPQRGGGAGGQDAPGRSHEGGDRNGHARSGREGGSREAGGRDGGGGRGGDREGAGGRNGGRSGARFGGRNSYGQ